MGIDFLLCLQIGLCALLVAIGLRAFSDARHERGNGRDIATALEYLGLFCCGVGGALALITYLIVI